jgi:hypothetical protein
MDKEKLKKQIDGAYSMITGVYVKGADAKRVAMAMQNLENAFAELDKPDEPTAKEGKAKLEKKSEVTDG